MKRHAPVRAVRAQRGVTRLTVALARQQQCIGQWNLASTPAGAQVHAHNSQLRSQCLGQGDRPGLQPLQVVLPTTGQRLSRLGQLVIPGIEHPRRPALLEQGVALLQSPRIAPPQGKKVWFHVEQAPIEETPARFTTTTHQGMAAWFKGDHRQRGTQVSELGNVFAIQAPFPLLSTMPQARFSPLRRQITALLVPFHEDLQGFMALTHQAITYPPAETPPIGHQMQRFKDAGLASAVVTGQQIHPWLGRQLHCIETTQLVEGKTTNLHGMRQTIRTWR
ncbi:hypothetical protein D3C73_1005230 [compost metagenome]